MSQNKTVIHWFRKGLRIHDNPALTAAVNGVLTHPGYVLRPIFILDPGIRASLKVGANRWRFLMESLTELDENLKVINSQLYVLRGQPEKLFPKLFADWNVEILTFEHDIEPYAMKRDAAIEKMAHKAGIRLVVEKSHTVYDHEEIIRKNLGKAPMTYNSFLSLASTCEISAPLDPPRKLPKGVSPKSDLHERKDVHCYDIATLEELKVIEADLGEVFHF